MLNDQQIYLNKNYKYKEINITTNILKFAVKNFISMHQDSRHHR